MGKAWERGACFGERKTKPVKVIETADLHERVNSQIVMTVILE